MFHIKWLVFVIIKMPCFYIYNTFNCHFKPNQKCQSDMNDPVCLCSSKDCKGTAHLSWTYCFSQKSRRSYSLMPHRFTDLWEAINCVLNLINLKFDGCNSKSKNFLRPEQTKRKSKSDKKWTATKSKLWKPFIQNTVIVAKFDTCFHFLKGI